MRQIIAFMTVAVLTLSTMPLFAHDEFRIIGTVTKRQAVAIEVKAKDGKTTRITLNKQTLISRDKKRVDPAELKAGGYVVVDALGDTEDDLLAIEVRLVPAPAK